MKLNVMFPFAVVDSAVSFEYPSFLGLASNIPKVRKVPLAAHLVAARGGKGRLSYQNLQAPKHVGAQRTGGGSSSGESTYPHHRIRGHLQATSAGGVRYCDRVPRRPFRPLAGTREIPKRQRGSGRWRNGGVDALSILDALWRRKSYALAGDGSIVQR